MSFTDESERKSAQHWRIASFLFLVFVATLVAGFFWATATPGESYAGPESKPKDAQLAGRLERHVEVLASEPRSLRKLASINRTIAYLEAELTANGYVVSRQEVLAPAENIIIHIRAKRTDAPILIVGAHYDSFGPAPGADDNASGVAALLELARSLKKYDGESAVELQLIFFANEEPPYFKTNAMGSFVHASALTDPRRIAGMISLESIGYFSDEKGSQRYPFPLSLRYPSTGNFIAFVGDLSSRDFLRDSIGAFRENARVASVGGTAPASLQGIDWSDHWAYSERGIPALMVTDTAIFRNPNYHRVTDTADSLDFKRMALVVEGLESWLTSLMSSEAQTP